MKNVPSRMLCASFAFFVLLGASRAALADNNLTLTSSGAYDPSSGRVSYVLHWALANAAVQDLQIVSQIPAGTTFVWADGPGKQSGNAITWDLGPRSAGSGDLHFIVSVDAASALNPWASKVISFIAGTTVPATLQDPHAALGAADNKAVALGAHTPAVPGSGQLVLSFDLPVYNASGSDVAIYSTSGTEKATVEASADGASWLNLGTITGSGSVDLGSLVSARYIRITDATDAVSAGSAGSYGYAVDAVKMRNLFPFSCNIQSSATAIGYTNVPAYSASAAGRVDVVPNCGSGSGVSGMSGVSGGIFSPGVPTVIPATSTPATGGSITASTTPATAGGGSSTSAASTSPVSGGGGGSISGGSGPVTTAAPSSISMPGGMGGANEQPAVLGASTALPRTGLPFAMAVAIIPSVFALTRYTARKRK